MAANKEKAVFIKTKDIARQQQFDADLFDQYIEERKELYKVDSGIFSNSVAAEDVERAVKGYRQHCAQLEAKRVELARNAEQRRRAIGAMPVTSGFGFDGFTVTRYSGYISTDSAAQIDRDKLFTKNGQMLTDALTKIRLQAMKELKEAAYDLGCNAIIGVDFDYLTFEPESIQQSRGETTHLYQPYVVCVTANGNAVVIEKNQ